MSIEEMIKLVMDNGMSVVLVGYFLYKDYKFNQNIIDVLGEIKLVLTELRTWHAKEDE